MKKLISASRNVALSFALAASAGAQQPATAPASTPATADNAKSDYTYWKTEFFDAVIAIRKCPETGICGYLHWLNPKDEKIFDYLGDPKTKRQRVPNYESGVFNGVTENDIKALCGYSPAMQFKQVADKKWTGTLDMRGMGFNVNMNVEERNENELYVVTTKAFYTQKETWRRVKDNDPRYPRCFAPK